MVRSALARVRNALRSSSPHSAVAKKPLRHDIDEAAPDTAHRSPYSGFLTAPDEGQRRILAPLSWMFDDLSGLALTRRHVERGKHQFSSQGAIPWSTPQCAGGTRTVPPPDTESPLRSGVEQEAGRSRTISPRVPSEPDVHLSSHPAH